MKDEESGMPQAVLFVAVTMGVVAGLRWLSRELLRKTEEAAHVADGARRGNLPKDLGPLEYDAEAEVYRPKFPHS